MVNRGFSLIEALIVAGFILIVAAGLYFYLDEDIDTAIVNTTVKNYVGSSPEECSRIQVLCARGFHYFEDDSGCGCQEIIEDESKIKSDTISDFGGSTLTETEEKMDIGIPTNLSLPFNIADIDEQNGEVNPFGVVRFNADLARYGHSGIDIPLRKDADIYAVADGRIVIIKPAGDPWGGMGIYQLLEETKTGEGWGFIYEHIKLASGIEEGSEVTKGQLIATKIAPKGFTAHFQMSYHFNTYQFTSDLQCWPDFLSEGEKKILNTWWMSYKKTPHLLNSWKSTFEEGHYAFRGLLDSSAYPDGPQFCYPQGTDVR